MKITYDQEVDAASLFFRKGSVARTIEVTPFILAHLDENNRPLSIELLGVSQFSDEPERLEFLGMAAELIQSEVEQG